MVAAEIIEKVIELNKANKSLREIGVELKIGKTTVASILKKQNSPTEPKITISELPVPAIIESTGIVTTMDTKNFLNSLIETAPVVAQPGQDAFLASFMSDIMKDDKTSKAKKMPKNKILFSEIPETKYSETKYSNSEVRQTVAKQEPVKPLEKGELIAKITLTVNTFEDQLRDYIKPNKDEFLNSLSKKTQNELSALISTMDYSRSINNTTAVMKSLTLTGAALLEMGTKRFLKMRTDGFTDMLRASDLENLLKEIAMENQNGIISKYQSPTVRLTTLIITSLFAVDARNRSNVYTPMSQGQNQNQQSTEGQDLRTKYNDL